ncbi:MAG: hypothetical protein WAX69_15640, partial [Victivallales bacterium]
MNKYLKYLSITFFALGVAVLAINLYLSLKDEGNVLYPKNALAVYSDRELTVETQYVLKPFNYYPVFDAKRILIDTRSISDQTMIRRYTVSNEIELFGKRYWCSENIIVVIVDDKNGGKVLVRDLHFEVDAMFLPFILFGLSLGLFLFYRYLRTSSIIYSFLFYLVLWYTGILVFFYIHGFFFVYNVDNNDWVMMGREWLEGNRIYFRSNTFGLTYLYAFFILLLNAKCFNDLAVPVSLVNFVFVGGGTLISTLYISYKLFNSKKILHATGIIAILVPLTSWIFHKGVFGQEDFIGKTMMYFGPQHPYSLSHWYQAMLLCWNGMSDNFSIFFALAGFSSALWMRPSKYKYLVLGFILGLGLCFRSTSILLWPTIFLLDFYFNYKDEIEFRKVVGYCLIFMIISFLSYLPQPIDNYLNYGHI